jgi:hypothetical protein
MLVEGQSKVTGSYSSDHQRLAHRGEKQTAPRPAARGRPGQPVAIHPLLVNQLIAFFYLQL